MFCLRALWKCSLVQQTPSLRNCAKLFSISSCSAGSHKSNAYEYRRRWTKTDQWRINKFTNRPWAPNVPMELTIDLWSKELSYFGAYDFMDILGDDLTLDPNLLCQGPEYMRGQKLDELQLLVKRRQACGTKMHAESLQQMEKRIKYLLKRQSRVRNVRTRHRRLDKTKVPLIEKESFE